MQNSLFTLNPVTDSDRVTGSDVVFGKTYGKSSHKGINEKPVTICHSVTNRAEAILLKANLERRGVLLSAENDAIVCDGNSAIIDRFAIDIVRLKPALIQLLAPDDVATVHRWEKSATDATGSDPAATSPTSAPDLFALSVAVAGAQRGAFLSPTPDLMACWRALDQYTGVKLTSRHIGAAARLADQYPETSNGDLLELFVSGLQPDEGAGKPVWLDPAQLADETLTAAKSRAKEHKETQTL